MDISDPVPTVDDERKGDRGDFLRPKLNLLIRPLFDAGRADLLDDDDVECDELDIRVFDRGIEVP